MTMFRIRRKEVLKDKIEAGYEKFEELMYKMEHESDKLMDLEKDLQDWR